MTEYYPNPEFPLLVAFSAVAKPYGTDEVVAKLGGVDVSKKTSVGLKPLSDVFAAAGLDNSVVVALPDRLAALTLANRMMDIPSVKRVITVDNSYKHL